MNTESVQRGFVNSSEKGSGGLESWRGENKAARVLQQMIFEKGFGGAAAGGENKAVRKYIIK